jgi:hypothetical protein
MNKDIKAISEQYNQGINNTERFQTSYGYPAVDYSTQRSEQEEGNLKSEISLDLNNALKRAQRGLPEDYRYILLTIERLKKNIAGLI